MRQNEAGRLLTGQKLLWYEEEDLQNMQEVNVQGSLQSSSSQWCNHPVSQKNLSKVKAKAKGHSKKLTQKSMDGMFDDWAPSSSRPHDACGAKVRVSSVIHQPALAYELSNANNVYAACRAIDVACTGAEVDNHAVDIHAACDAIDAACASNTPWAFDIEAACHAIDVACAYKDRGCGKAGLAPADMKLCMSCR